MGLLENAVKNVSSKESAPSQEGDTDPLVVAMEELVDSKLSPEQRAEVFRSALRLAKTED